MNELEKKLLDKGFVKCLPMSQERRDDLCGIYNDTCENALDFEPHSENAQRAMTVLWDWFFAAELDADSYQEAVKSSCERINTMCNQTFDWRDGENGARLVERLKRLRHLQSALETVTALFDEIAAEGRARDMASKPQNIEYSIPYHPPRARDFYRAILKTLQLIGGLGEAKSVLQLVRETTGAQTDDLDFTRLATPHITSQQWRDIGNRAARQMTQKGLLIRDSGDWAITREGEVFLEEE